MKNKDTLVENLEIINLLLNDIPKKYSFVDKDSLKETVKILIDHLGG